ncbi:unnamed protein product [Laminaria digitata]
MFSTAKAVRGIQGRLPLGSAGIARRAGSRRALEQSPRRQATRSLSLVPAVAAPAVRTGSLSSNHQRRAYAAFSTAGRAGQVVVVKEKGGQITEDVVHDRFLACVEKEDANGALAHFAFIACEGGASLTLRRRQLLVLLCEKGMVKEASDLLTNAVASPAFDAQDVSTIASFMYVMCGCLRGGNVDWALEHFRQASQRGIGLDLPLCEGLATALFIKGLQGDATEMEAWNVLEYIRQRGMVHRPEVCDHALLYATATDDLSFALRMCQYIDEEGLWCDLDVRDALCRSVRVAIKGLPETAAVTTGDGAAAAEEWKVEGTNATVEELRALGALLQGWLDSEMDEFDDFVDEEEEGQEEEEEVRGKEESVVSAEGPESEKGDVLDSSADVVDYDGVESNIGDVDDMGAADVVDFDESIQGKDINDDDDDEDGGASHASLGETAAQSQRAASGRGGVPKPDFGAAGFCGDLMDQMSVLRPGREVSFKMDGDEVDSYPHGSLRGQGRGGGGSGGAGHDLRRRSVYADLVMPYGDPHGEGGQGIMSIPVRISVELEENDDDDDDDDDDKDGAV